MPTTVPGDYSPLTPSSVKTLGIIHYKYAGAGPQAWPLPPPHAVMFLSKHHMTAHGAFSLSKLRFKSQLRFKSISSY